MKHIRFDDPMTVGEFPYQIQVRDAHIAAIAFTSYKQNRDNGIAHLSIVLESSEGNWTKNIVIEDSADVKALMDRVLEITLTPTGPTGVVTEGEEPPSPKSVAHAILERMQAATEGQFRHLPTGTIEDMPATESEGSVPIP